MGIKWSLLEDRANATVRRAGYSEYPEDDASVWDRESWGAACCFLQWLLTGAMPGFFTLFFLFHLKSHLLSALPLAPVAVS